MDTMQLLSRVFNLLGECSSKDLEAAAAAVGERTDLGQALRTLSRFRRTYSRGAAKDLPWEKVPPDAWRTATTGKPPPQAALTPAKLRELILSPRYFPKKRDLVEFLARSGLKVKDMPKESRERFASRVLTELNARSLGEQAEILKAFVARQPTDEVARWFNVIRG